MHLRNSHEDQTPITTLNPEFKTKVHELLFEVTQYSCCQEAGRVSVTEVGLEVGLHGTLHRGLHGYSSRLIAATSRCSNAPAPNQHADIPINNALRLILYSGGGEARWYCSASCAINVRMSGGRFSAPAIPRRDVSRTLLRAQTEAARGGKLLRD
jgi:hypothetical protein